MSRHSESTVANVSARGKQRSIFFAGALLAIGLGAPSTPAQEAKETAERRLSDAASALRRGSIDQAVQLYTDAIADRGLSTDRRAIALTDRGAAHMRRRAYKAAIDDFNRAVQLSPEYTPAYNNRGNALIAIGAVREAIKDFDRALVLAPSYSAAFANRGSAHYRLGALDQALADFTRAIELTPQSVSAINGRGLVHLAANRAHAAYREFSRAVAIDLRFAAGYRNRAAAHTVLGRLDQAVEDLSRAITFDGQSTESHLLRGDAYLASGNVPAAIKDYSRVLELAPRSANAFASRALAHAKADALDEALADLSKAVEIDPRLSRAYAVRAWTYRKLNQLDLAQKDMERALKLEPVTADALWAQGEIEDARGRNEAAIQAFTKALTLDPRHRPTLDSLNRLGLVATRDEVEVSGGADGWRLYQAGNQFVARHAQFSNLTVSLEMLANGTPRILAFERQKPPYANYAVLRFHAGRQELPGQPAEDLEAAILINTQSQKTVGLVLDKRGEKAATWAWEEGRVVITSADGFTEDFALERMQIASSGTTVERSGQRASGSASSRTGGGQSGGTPAWAPWAQNTPGYRAQGGGSRQANRPPPKQKSLFEMLFGN